MGNLLRLHAPLEYRTGFPIREIRVGYGVAKALVLGKPLETPGYRGAGL